MEVDVLFQINQLNKIFSHQIDPLQVGIKAPDLRGSEFFL